MKTEFVDVTDTRKKLVVEIPSTVVDAEIDRVARDYSKAARIPGFRPGKVPPKVVRQRFRDQILHDVVHELDPARRGRRAAGARASSRSTRPTSATWWSRKASRSSSRPISTPCRRSIRATTPTLQLRRPKAAVEDDAVEQALERLRQRAARYEPVEGRPVEAGDTVVVDLVREATPSAPADTARGRLDRDRRGVQPAGLRRPARSA